MEGKSRASRSSGMTAFGFYLRTGRRIVPRPPIEVKFNPYHDPDDGRFTFKDGAGANAGVSPTQERPELTPGREDPRILVDDRRRKQRDWAADPRNPANQSAYTVKAGDSLSKIAKLRNGLTPGDVAWLNGIPENGVIKVGQQIKIPSQASLDAERDNMDRGIARAYYMETHGGNIPPYGQKVPSVEEQILAPQNWQVVSKNGYKFSIDAIDRVQAVNGELGSGSAQNRSRKNQSEAGGNERRPLDDGGHYIAPRFGGPTDAINHFAQDRNFNRGAYRALEGQWATAQQNKTKVWVDIRPYYKGLSVRPYKIVVRYKMDNVLFKKEFPNERTKK